MSKRMLRHTCTVCGKKRDEDVMRPVAIAHNGLKIWACMNIYLALDCARRFEVDFFENGKSKYRTETITRLTS